jgi:hypothetical protein
MLSCSNQGQFRSEHTAAIPSRRSGKVMQVDAHLHGSTLRLSPAPSASEGM